MAFTLSRIDRISRAVPGNVDVALLPPRSAPTAATVWLSGDYDAEADATTFLFAGPDADSTGAVVVPASADLWKREADAPEVDAEKVERITVLGGSSLAALPSAPVTSVNGLTGAVHVPWVIVHGDNPDYPRPDTDEPVIWYGTVDPLDADDTRDVTVPLSEDVDGFEVAASDESVAALVADSGSETAAALGAAFDSVDIAAARATANAEAAGAVARLQSLFLGPAAGLFASRSGTTYSLLRGLGGGRYSKFDLVLQSGNLGGYPLHQLQACAVAVLLLSVDETAGTTSGTWTSGSNAASYGGAYKYATANTATYTWTSPAGSTRLGLRIAGFSNGGYGKVSIGGDATAATLLPTAQEEVTAGRLASAALVANGGTLNPTDRLVNTYRTFNMWDGSVLLADGLTAAAHTVVYTATGYGPTGSSGTRAYISGFMSGTAATLPTDSGAALANLYELNSAVNSAWEYAIDYLPAGATTHAFVGNVHGYEVEDGFTLTVDGAATTLTDGQIMAASREVVITRTSHLLHPDTGSTVVANSVVQYRIDRLGLAVTPGVTFQVPTSVLTCYAMMALNGASVATGVPMNRAAALAGTSVLTQTGTGTKRLKSKSAACWMWNDTGKVGALMYVPDIWGFTEGWAHADPGYLEIEDRPPTTNYGLSKAYLAWVHPGSAPVAVPAGFQKTWTTRYVIGYFANGAEASLATV